MKEYIIGVFDHVIATESKSMLSSPLLTVHEVAELLKVRESTVRSWINDNQLRAIKFGRDWRVSQRDLESYLNAHANRAPDTD